MSISGQGSKTGMRVSVHDGKLGKATKGIGGYDGTDTMSMGKEAECTGPESRPL